MEQKNDENTTSRSKAFIKLQIQVKNKEIQELMNETSLLEAKNQKLIKLRDQLREEQLGHIRTLCKQAREQDRKLDQSETANKEQVEQALKHNLQLSHHQAGELAELRRQLTALEMQLSELHVQRQVLLEYKTVGSVEHQQHILGLQAELNTLQKNFQEMSENIRCSRDATFNEIDKKTSQMIDEEKQLAAERVIKQLDKSGRLQIMENEWLKRETAIYREEVSTLETAVRNLEEENLMHVNQLFEQRLSDLQISRNVFLTQAAGLQPMDLGNAEQPMQTLAHSESTEAESGPWPVPGTRQRQAELLDQEGKNHSFRPSAPACDLDVFPLGSQSDLRELLHLGPLEQKLLTVIGQAMTLHPMPSDPEGVGTAMHLDFLEIQDWALTTSIIRNKFL